MILEYAELPGEKVEADALAIPRARQIASTIVAGRIDFVRLIECRKDSLESAEILVVDVEVERPQVVVNQVLRLERLAIVLAAEDDQYPQVLAIRKGFPVVPHLNLSYDENARSLCLYDQSWDEVKAKWTVPQFIERIRDWLADTATGSLHREDQPLEQVMAGSGYSLVMPWSVVSSANTSQTRLDVVLVPSDEHSGTFIAMPLSENSKSKFRQFTVALFVAESRQHGIIHRAPRNLDELCEFVSTKDYDLLSELRKRVVSWKNEGFLDVSLIFVVVFPLQRGETTSVEIHDTWAFVTEQTVFEVGKKIGVWDKTDGIIGAFIAPIETLKGADVVLDVVRPQFGFSRVAAARASGIDVNETKTVAVGAGALGSQVVLNLVREAFGKWTIIDNDELLPHNLARHALLPNAIGFSKAQALAATISSLFEDESHSKHVVANILNPGKANKDLEIAFKDAELILDCSASVPVARHLARDAQSEARRASLFLNPLGTDLVCIFEDPKRSLPLDGLEPQYYRAIIRTPDLAGHLIVNESRARYARSCADISFAIPSHLVAMHSAIGAQAVRSGYALDRASVRIWRADPSTSSVAVIEVPLFPSYRAKIGDWTVVLDQWIIDHLHVLRSERLPNETGGVLIGMFDMSRQTVYVVDTIHSPPDSKEDPSFFIRGCEHLLERVQSISNKTAGELAYIGEWHSHPDGCSCAPSNHDLILFENITDRMSAAGYPGFMAIVGDQKQSAWFLGAMDAESSWGAPSS